MGLPARKDSAVPTMFPKPNAIRTGSMKCVYGSIHYTDSEISISSSNTSNARSAVIKRKKAKILYFRS